MISIEQMLEHVDEARRSWCFKSDPGLGRHAFGLRYILHIKENRFSNKFDLNYSIELKKLPGHPITMAHDWESFDKNLRKPPADKKESMVDTKNEKLRQKIRLKCMNDWGLDLTEDEITMCIIEMEESDLSLFYDQIWPNKRKSTKKVGDDYIDTHRLTWDKTVDGYRAVAQRSGRFAGIEAPVFENVDTRDGVDTVARVTVYALDGLGVPRPYTGEARFNEFVQLVPEYVKNRKTGNKVPNSTWQNAPYNQLGIAAERQALRKAFQQLGRSGHSEMVRHPPEPPVERSRGEVVPLPVDEVSLAQDLQDAKQPTPAKQPGPAALKSKPSGPEEPEPKRLSLPPTPETPLPNWDAIVWEKNTLSNGEQIVMHAAQKDGTAWLALDSGYKVHVTAELRELERKERTDKFRGGRDWQVGDVYYDGAKVLAVAKTKKDETGIWLRLEGDSKVFLNRWGKELKRKQVEDEPEPKRPKPATQTSDEAPAVAGEYDGQDPRPEPASPPAYEPPGDAKELVDYRAIDTVEMMRKFATPLWKKWCDVNGKRFSAKEAYMELTGVVIGQEGMSLGDYRAFYEALVEFFKADAASAGEGYQ